MNSKFLEKIAIRATRWVGSTQSLMVHTILFFVAFVLVLVGIPIDRVLLVLTTIVSLEAIYLSIFIQMSVNRSERRIKHVSREIQEISEDVEGIEKDIDEIQKDVEEISEDVGEIQADVEGIEKDIDEIQADVDEIQEDVEGIEKDIDEIEKDVDDIAESEDDEKQDATLKDIQKTLQGLIEQINKMK